MILTKFVKNSHRGVNERVQNRRERRVNVPPQVWRPWEEEQEQQPINIQDVHENPPPVQAEEPPQVHENPPAQAEPGEDEVPLQQERPNENVRGNPINVPEVGGDGARGGRREQLYTLLRRNAETTDRLLNGRFVEMTDVQLRVLRLLEQRLSE